VKSEKLKVIIALKETTLIKMADVNLMEDVFRAFCGKTNGKSNDQ